MNYIKHLFSTSYILNKTKTLGDIPSSSEAYRRTLLIAYPCVIEALLISLISSVDTIMVGTISIEAISAVGITNQPRFVLLAIIMSINVGITAVISRRKGEDNVDGANSCLKQGVILSVIAAFLLSFIGIVFAKPLMSFAGANVDIIEDATIYFKIISVGLFFNAISLTINAAQRGVGNTKVSMTTNLTANVFNMIFNYLLINGIFFFPQLGIVGAGIATVIGNFVGCLLSIVSVCKKDDLAFLSIFSSVPWKFDKKTLSSILRVGNSAFIEQVFQRIGFLLYAIIIAKLGTVAFATHQIAMTILNFSFSGGDGLGIAASSLVGQNLGAKRPDLANLYCRITQRIAIIFSSVVFLIFIFGRRALIGLFTDDLNVIATGATIMIIMAFITHIQTSQVIVSGCLRGAGDTKFIAFTSLISIAIIRPALTYLLCFPLGLGIYGAWIALLLDQVIRYFINSFRFNTGKWSKIVL